MAEIRIDLDKLKKSALFIEEYLCLQFVFEGINPEQFNWTDKNTIRILSDNLWIKHTEGGEYQLRQKGRDLFQEKLSQINFDEFWNVFPSSTSDGRVLRSRNHVWQDALTRDYVICKKKYLSKIKSKEVHDKIVAIVKTRAESGDTKFMANIETYINGENWTKDEKYLTQTSRVTAK
jgi:hypothetical protein